MYLSFMMHQFSYVLITTITTAITITAFIATTISATPLPDAQVGFEKLLAASADITNSQGSSSNPSFRYEVSPISKPPRVCSGEEISSCCFKAQDDGQSLSQQEQKTCAQCKGNLHFSTPLMLYIYT